MVVYFGIGQDELTSIPDGLEDCLRRTGRTDRLAAHAGTHRVAVGHMNSLSAVGQNSGLVRHIVVLVAGSPAGRTLVGHALDIGLEADSLGRNLGVADCMDWT